MLFGILLPAIVMTCINYNETVKIITSIVKDNLESSVKQRINFIEQNSKHLLKTLTVISHKKRLANAFSKGDENEMFSILNPRAHAHSFYDMFLISKKGTIEFTLKKESDFHKNLYDKAFSQTKFALAFKKLIQTKKATIANFSYYKPSHKYASFLLVPIFKGSKLVSVLAAQLDIDMFVELSSDYTGLGKSGEIVFAEKIGNKAIFINKLRNDDKKIFTRYVKIGSKNGIPIQKAVAGKFGSGIFDDYKDVEVIAAWGYIESFHIGMVLKINTSEAYAQIEYLKNLVLLMGVIIFFVILYLIWYIKEIVKEIEDNRVQYEYAINGTEDGLWDWNIKENNIYFSQNWKKMLGYKDDELKNKFETWISLIHPDDLEEAKKEIVLAHSNPNVHYHSIHRLQHKDGSWVWILDRGKTIFDKDLKPVRMIGFHTNITKLKELELALVEKEYLLQEAQRLSKMGSWKLDFSKDELLWSDEVYIIFNLDKNIFIPSYQAFLEIIHPDDREMVDLKYNESLQRKKPYKITHRLLMKSGEIKYVEESCETSFDSNGDPLVSIGTVQDITIQKLLENKLTNLKQQFEQFMENMPANIMIKENDKVIYANSTAKTFFNKKNILGKTLENLFPLSVVEELKKFQNKVKLEGKAEKIIEVINKKNEKKVYRYMAFLLDSKEIKKIGIVSTDITKEYQANKEVAQVLSAFDRSNVSVVITNLDGDIRYVNPSWCKLTGYSREELLGQNPRIVKSGYISDKSYKEMWDELTQGRVWSSELKNRAKDGTEFWEDSTIIPSFNEEGVIDGYIAFKLEIGEKIRLKQEIHDKEEIMIVQSRHAAMGEMISMIAHQWRQPISVISMDANNVLVDIELDNVESESLKSDVTDIIKQTQYLSKTIDDFRNFFKPSKIKDEVLISDVFNESLSVILKSLENNNIEVINKFETQTLLNIFSRELLQVFINILKNAKEALLENRELDKKIMNKIYEDETSVIILICDNAGGISDDIVEKIFEPYFTTKESKNGTGLGLYMSKTIIEKHLKGSIIVKNNSGGVCFEIRLPKIEINYE
jgi:PAS domain S-box-containing protein